MDIYTAAVEIIAGILAVSRGFLDSMVVLPANTSGPLDPNATVTGSGMELAQHIAATGMSAADILCDMLEAIF